MLVQRLLGRSGARIPGGAARISAPMMASALPRRIPTPAPSRTQATFAAQTTCPFTILRVSPNAPMSEIKRAYFLMAAQTHPDTVSPEAAEAAGGDPQAISAQFHRITAAYQLLQSQEGRHQAALQHKQAVGRAPSGSSGSWQHEERREQQEREWHEWRKQREEVMQQRQAERLCRLAAAQRERLAQLGARTLHLAPQPACARAYRRRGPLCG